MCLFTENETFTYPSMYYLYSVSIPCPQQATMKPKVNYLYIMNLVTSLTDFGAHYLATKVVASSELCVTQAVRYRIL